MAGQNIKIEATTTTVKCLTSGLHAHFTYHYEGDKPRCLGINCRQKSGHIETRGDGEAPHTQKWISTPVPEPKRSTLGVVAALDSVVGLCSGIESNISKNKDRQPHGHSDFKSGAFRR